MLGRCLMASRMMWSHDGDGGDALFVFKDLTSSFLSSYICFFVILIESVAVSLVLSSTVVNSIHHIGMHAIKWSGFAGLKILFSRSYQYNIHKVKH
jgi:hypothetical protein